MTLTPRHFVAWVSAALPIALIARRADALGAAWITEDDAILRALAETVLPSELGRDGIGVVANGFQHWIDDYKAGVEEVHGYGTSALSFTRPSPRARWSAQLQELGADFPKRTIAERRSQIAPRLSGYTTARLPEISSAPHVALGLLAYYYSSPAAMDLCYDARIGRQTCRPLQTQSRKPLPLAESRS